MLGDQSKWRTWAAPPIAADISDDFALLRAERLQQQSRLLFLALLLTIPTAVFGAAPDAPQVIRLGFPLFLAICCITGFLMLRAIPPIAGNVRLARQLVRRATQGSVIIALLWSVWAVFSWHGAAPGTQLYYPVILTMGSLATAYCFSAVRGAAILNIVIALVPALGLLLASGTRMDLAFGCSLLLAAAFMVHMVIGQHNQLTAVLTLQQRMRLLADTDPLTGLANRRALADRIDALLNVRRVDARPFTLVLFDLDGFKTVNDRLGHAAGDLLLCTVGDRLRQAAGDQATVARIGGDEFAALFPGADAHAGQVLAARLLATLLLPVQLGDDQERIGASLGIASWPADGATRGDLYLKADLALHTAKAERYRRPLRRRG